jgi:nitric oxide reductase NorD protein
MIGLAEQKAQFYASILPAQPNEWEVDEVFDQLAALPGESREVLLSQVATIWPVSHSLCFAYLREGVSALRAFSVELVPEWVRQVLAVYEKKGLAGARTFMADIDKHFLGPMRGEAGVGLAEVSSILMPYIRGISGRHLHLDSAIAPGTDTTTIYLPDFLDQFPQRDKNILLFKVLASLQWGQIASGIYQEVAAEVPGGQSDDPLRGYPDRQLANDLLAALQFRRVYAFLAVELPGLVRQGSTLCTQLIEQIVPQDAKERCQALQAFLQQPVSCRITSKSLMTHSWQSKSLDLLPEIYANFSTLAGSYHLGPAALLLGELNFSRAGRTISLRRQEEKQQFVAMLAAFLGDKRQPAAASGQTPEATTSITDVLALLQQVAAPTDEARARDQIVFDNEGTPIPEALLALTRNIINDFGRVPQAYGQAAAGLAGGGMHKGNQAIAETASTALALATEQVFRYDEWDYRRGGYRSDWCNLEEKSLSPVRSGFVAATLTKYGVLLKKMRRQFEMLRTTDRIVRRQREGDDIDLDALIEALGDYQAGFIPSDRLFTRLLRDSRSITTMFLVDMSSSTEGWIGVALKEALVLLAEALETAGDQFGIYGFSGMRRSRSQLFHIKHPEEPYGTVVQRRIAAIAPRDYTRMGPPIRHLTKKLLESQSKIRLLVVISDGKPEDYDDYKGQYAIEDTRKALLEAKGVGVHSFCITIDKSAHEYLAHMFGARNYIFVNNINALPLKMVQMYRLLTS